MLKAISMVVVGASAGSPEKLGYQVVERLVKEGAPEIYVVHPLGEDIVIEGRTISGFVNLRDVPPVDNLAFYIPRKLIFNEKPSPDKYGTVWVPPVEGLDVMDEGSVRKEREDLKELREHFHGLGYIDDHLLMGVCYLRGN